MVLHDTNLELFDQFIKYLYTGMLTSSETESYDKSLDEIVGLLTYADKYEVWMLIARLVLIFEKQVLKLVIFVVQVRFFEKVAGDQNNWLDNFSSHHKQISQAGHIG